MTVALVRHFSQRLGTRRHKAGRNRVRIGNLDVEHDSGTTEGFRAERVVVRVFIGEENRRASDSEFSVTDLAVFTGETMPGLLGTESPLVEVDSCRTIVHGQIGREDYVDHPRILAIAQ